MSEPQLLHQNHGQGGPEPQVIRQRVQLARALDPNRRKLIEYKEWYRRFNRAIERGYVDDYIQAMRTQSQFASFNPMEQFKREHNSNDILKVACLHGRHRLVKHLLETGWKQKVNESNNFKESPLHLAITHGLKHQSASLSLIRTLVRGGANLLLKDGIGRSCLELVEESVPAYIREYITDIYETQKSKKEAVNLIFFANYTQVGRTSYINRLPKAYQRCLFSYF